MKRYLIFFSLFLTTAAVFGQKKNSTTAFSGYKGNYIYNMFKPASPNHPDGDVIGFKLERKAANATVWEMIRQFNTPEDPETLAVNVARSIPMVFSYNPNTAYNVEEVWAKFKKTFNYDSIGVYISQQHIAMGFNAVLSDSAASKAANYQYRVTQVKKDNSDGMSYTTNVVSGTQSLNVAKPVLKSRTTAEGKVQLVYKARKTTPVDALLIRRKEGTGSKFERVEPFYSIENTADSTLYTVVDEQIAAEQIYQYTIMPVNRFGGEGKITSDTVYAAIVEKNYLLPQMFKAVVDTLGTAVKLQWKFYKPELVSVVKVFRSEDYEDGYQYIGASIDNTTYLDASTVTGKKYYYYLTITDQLGQNSTRSAKVFALRQTTDKPTPVIGVTVRKVNGGNQVTWEDYANDTRGWWVYKTNSIEGELRQVGEFIYRDDKRNNKLFVDSASNNGTVGYAIVTENFSNVRGDFSKVVYLKAPENTVIAAPVIADVIKADNKYRIFWKDDAATADNISSYNIYRKSDGRAFVKVNKVPVSNDRSSYTDSLTNKGFALVYKVAAVNLAGKEVQSEEYLAERETAIFPPSSVKAFITKDKKAIAVNWQPSQSPVAKYEIYRFVNGSASVKIGEAAGTKIVFNDTAYARDKVNYYYMVAVGFNGGRSGKSNETFWK